jgi:hypothetical protein
MQIRHTHVHRVVQSIQADTLSRARYEAVDVVRVPNSELDNFRQHNNKFLTDPRLPPLAPTMKYAAISKSLHQVETVVRRKSDALVDS